MRLLMIAISWFWLAGLTLWAWLCGLSRHQHHVTIQPYVGTLENLLFTAELDPHILAVYQQFCALQLWDPAPHTHTHIHTAALASRSSSLHLIFIFILCLPWSSWLHRSRLFRTFTLKECKHEMGGAEKRFLCSFFCSVLVFGPLISFYRILLVLWVF